MKKEHDMVRITIYPIPLFYTIFALTMVTVAMAGCAGRRGAKGGGVAGSEISVGAVSDAGVAADAMQESIALGAAVREEGKIQPPIFPECLDWTPN